MTDDIGDLARELHDVAFAWNHTMPDWDSLRDEDRLWFRERAKRMQDGSREPAKVLRAMNEAFPSVDEAAERITERFRLGFQVSDAFKNMDTEPARAIRSDVDKAATRVPTWWQRIRKMLDLPEPYTPKPFTGKGEVASAHKAAPRRLEHGHQIFRG